MSVELAESYAWYVAAASCVILIWKLRCRSLSHWRSSPNKCEGY